MKKICVLILICFSFAIKAQKNLKEEPIYSTAGTAPRYPEGDRALFTFICQNLVIPSEPLTEKNKNTVMARFVVETDGNVTHPEIMKGIGTAYDKEALKVVNLLPKWEAGGETKYGQWRPLRMYMTIPIKFFQNFSACEASYNQIFTKK